jgi:hypothetical protein
MAKKGLVCLLLENELAQDEEGAAVPVCGLISTFKRLVLHLTLNSSLWAASLSEKNGYMMPFDQGSTLIRGLPKSRRLFAREGTPAPGLVGWHGSSSYRRSWAAAEADGYDDWSVYSGRCFMNMRQSCRSRQS